MAVGAGTVLRAWALALGAGWLAPVGAQPQSGPPARPAVDFLDERLPIPDSEHFTEADYIQSGVGLSFGVDKRLSYLTGRYAEAVERFEAALKQFRYKSEIWVFLARSYFYLKQPEMARQALVRAAAVMPDLDDRLWRPLTEGLEWQIRQRANQLQMQVEFYSPGPDDLLALFRLYRFLSDGERATAVIGAADAKGRRMQDLASSASGPMQRAYREEGQRWRALADSLRAELDTAGVSLPVQQAPADTADQALVEATQLLQLRVDFYSAGPKEYRALFGNYLRLGQPDRARQVLAALTRETARVGLMAETVADAAEQERYKAQVAALTRLRQELESSLAPAGPPP